MYTNISSVDSKGIEAYQICCLSDWISVLIIVYVLPSWNIFEVILDFDSFLLLSICKVGNNNGKFIG